MQFVMVGEEPPLQKIPQAVSVLFHVIVQFVMVGKDFLHQIPPPLE